MRYISRSSHDTFRECPRKGYWKYLSGPWNGAEVLGLEEQRDNINLTVGILWHEAAEEMLRSRNPWGAVLAAKNNPLWAAAPVNWQSWLYAAVLAWDRVAADEFHESWEILSIEDEFEIPVSPNVMFYTRADAVVRDRGDGSVWVLNWKTTSDIKDFTKKWFFDPQGWSEAIAAESRLGIEVSGCIYLGVYKGPHYKGDTTSRLIYGYRNNSRAGVTYSTSTNGSAIKFNAWEERFPFGEGLPAWISFLDKDFLKGHFVQSAPQIRQDSLVEDWLRQVVRYENDIDAAMHWPEEDRNSFFYQNWSDHNCGRCAFRDLCLKRATPEGMLEEGLLRPRSKSPRDEAAGRKIGEAPTTEVQQVR